MKKKVLLTSILTIALCVSLIAGSTFALFTDSTDFNIAVTSGDVEIYAKAGINSIWSAEGSDTFEDKYLVDEYDNTYKHVDRTAEGTFINGGVAELTGANKQNLTISRLTPGDRVDVDIKVENRSDVAISFRYTIYVSKGEDLAKGMVVTTHAGESYEALKSFTSEWFDVVEAPNGKGNDIPVKTISIELPVYAGNEYQSEKEDQEDGRLAGEKSVEYTVVVEAVQGNAVVDKATTTAIVYPTNAALSTAFYNGGEISLDGATVNIEQAFLSKNEAIILSDGVFDGTNIPTVTEKGETRWVICNADDEEGVFSSNITLADGAKVIAPKGSDKQAIFLFQNQSGMAHELRIEKGASIVAGEGGYCIQVCYTTCNLYLEDLNSLQYDKNKGAYAIAVTAASTLNIEVPTEEMKIAVEALIADSSSNFILGDGTSVNVSVAK